MQVQENPIIILFVLTLMVSEDFARAIAIDLVADHRLFVSLRGVSGEQMAVLGFSIRLDSSLCL